MPKKILFSTNVVPEVHEQICSFLESHICSELATAITVCMYPGGLTGNNGEQLAGTLYRLQLQDVIQRVNVPNIMYVLQELGDTYVIHTLSISKMPKIKARNKQ